MKQSVTQNSQKYVRDELLQNVLDLLDADDGKTFAEKKKDIVDYIQEWANGPHADIAEEIQFGETINQEFWKKEKEITLENGITMRRVQQSDHEGYFAIQQAYSATAYMLKNPAYCDMLWDEHISSKGLTMTILRYGNYIGYCGINNILKENWEIGIELLPEYTGQGVGYCAISKMLNKIHERLGRDFFIARIDPRNIASQKLFEKLGALPDGITADWTENESIMLQCEEEYLDQIDEELINIAKKFNVAPRKLLSHVLKYSLKI